MEWDHSPRVEFELGQPDKDYEELLLRLFYIKIAKDHALLLASNQKQQAILRL